MGEIVIAIPKVHWTSKTWGLHVAHCHHMSSCSTPRAA